MQKLTAKQEKFVNGLIKGLSQREAYKQAYNASKMKDNTIDRKAYEVLKKDYVKARFDELNGKVVKKAEEKSIASATEVMEFYSDLMRGIKKDIHISYDTESNVIENKVGATLKERVKGADALAKRYGLNEINIKMETKNTLDVSKLTKEQIMDILDKE